MFVSTCRRFMDSLQKCGLILKDRVTLVIPDDDNIRHMPTVLNQHMISKFCQDSPDVVKGLDYDVASICNQVELYLIESEKVRIENDETGPETEQMYWRAKMACHNHVQMQMRDIYWINGALQILKYAGSNVVQRWNLVKQRI